ncbi:MAG: ribulose-phosphate 3-epimerase [Candidatus Thermoplasmatota archaeon]|jgi:ribulose-phosphate 3-epimerase|nr:ribulose-phosphate 3-epimerase [Candidatus Thermoplasmatota archaeon]
MELSASIISADQLNLERDLRETQVANVNWLHLDVMDGHFVPNLTFGIPLGQAIWKKMGMNIESHLMVDNPDRYLDRYSSFSKIITFHYEAPVQTSRVMKDIKGYGVKAGIAINPGTDPSKIERMLAEVDYVLVMTVEPGFSGQSLIESALEKIKILRDYREKQDLHYEIGVDGGVNRNNITKVASLRPDYIISASAIYNGNIKENINFLKGAIRAVSNGQ